MDEAASTGRPTKYDPAYCDIAIEFMRDGYSTTALAGHIGVARSTIYKWAEENEAFSDALKTAQAVGVMWWEDRLRNVASKNEGNASAAIFALKNRAPDDWRDKTVNEVVGKDGGAIQTEGRLNVSGLSTEALAEIVALSDAADTE